MLSLPTTNMVIFFAMHIERDEQIQTIVGLRNKISECLEKVWCNMHVTNSNMIVCLQSKSLEANKVTAENEVQMLRDMISSKKAETESVRESPRGSKGRLSPVLVTRFGAHFWLSICKLGL